jgi:hypothetical protein
MIAPAATALDVALLVGRALESLGLPYFVGGSVASSLQGEPRATNDIDVVVRMTTVDVGAVVDALGKDFAVDADALAEACRRRSSCNFFYLPLFTKVDLFICGAAPYDDEELRRRRTVRVRVDGAELSVKSPEDTVLRKLWWYRRGGHVSSRQWRDVVEVLRVSGPDLDADYMARWAAALRIEDLLARAGSEASGREPP